METDNILKHYGYSMAAPTIGRWPIDTALDRLIGLPEALRQMDAGKQKIRITFDCDPDFPEALLQIWGLRTATLLPDMGTQRGKPAM